MIHGQSLPVWATGLPKTWIARRLKYDATFNDDKLPEDFPEDADIDYIEISDVSQLRGVERFETVAFGDAPSRARRKLKSGDTLLSTVRTYLKAVAFVDASVANSVASTGFAVVRPSQRFNPRFLSWVLQSDIFVNEVVSYSVGVSYPAINAIDIANLIAIQPPLLVQQAIAAHLDRETAKIDTLIAKKRELIAKLKEQRSALISRTVTRGLPPEAAQAAGLDPNPNGHTTWPHKRLRFEISINPSRNEVSALPPDTSVSFVPMDAVGELGGLRLDETKELGEIGAGYTFFRDFDVVVAKITPCFENGKAAFVGGLTNSIAFGTTELHVMRAKPRLAPRFLFYVVISHRFNKIGESEMYGAGGQKRVPDTFVKDYRLGLPPFEEQVAIGQFLDDETAKIDVLAEKVETAIARLTEYRAALITAAVTGQVDVR